MSNRCYEPFNKAQSPTGHKAARRFPWWRSGTAGFGPLAAQGGVAGSYDPRILYFRPFSGRFNTGLTFDDAQGPLFRNESPWPVHITSIRFYAVQIESPILYPDWTSATADTLSRYAVKFSTPLQGQVVADFTPITALNTGFKDSLQFSSSGAVFTLPSDFFVAADAELQMDLDIALTLNTEAAAANVQVGMRGCDPYNNTPIIRCSDLRATTTLNKRGNEFVLYGDQGQGIRNMWVRDLVFGTDGKFENVENYWDYLVLKITPPYGPAWTKDLYTPLITLVDQPVSYVSGANYVTGNGSRTGRRTSVVRHDPVTPYVLLPQDRLNMELFPTVEFFDDSGISGEFIYCTVLGYQEVPNDAL